MDGPLDGHYRQHDQLTAYAFYFVIHPLIFHSVTQISGLPILTVPWTDCSSGCWVWWAIVVGTLTNDIGAIEVIINSWNYSQSFCPATLPTCHSWVFILSFIISLLHSPPRLKTSKMNVSCWLVLSGQHLFATSIFRGGLWVQALPVGFLRVKKPEL